MSSALSPGVRIVEAESSVRTITGVATSITAFVGSARKGPVNDPTRIQSLADYGRRFGGLSSLSPMSYAVSQYFQNGGSDAIIVRLFNGDPDTNTSTVTLSDLELRASSPGEWGDNLRATLLHPNPDDDNNRFNLTIEEIDPASGRSVTTERFLNLDVREDSVRFVGDVLEDESSLVRVADNQSFPLVRPDATVDANGDPEPVAAVDGGTGDPIDEELIAGDAARTELTGIYALRRADLFNLLCIPSGMGLEIPPETWSRAARFCREERAVLIVDPPSGWNSVDDAESDLNSLRSTIGLDNATNAAIYFPRLKVVDPLREGRTGEFPPTGAVAGVIARTDSQRGVWKAPAGIGASLSGVRSLNLKLTDGENGRLNPLGINCLRTFPVFGNVVWGSRTLAGSDQLASQWKYLPVRRLALFIEESLYRGTQFAVFEPNDEPLWASLRLNVGAFMQGLFRQGAFQGTTPAQAYFVKCDSETTTQNDINLGVVNVVVGFAPLKPAEFVVITIEQMAGQI